MSCRFHGAPIFAVGALLLVTSRAAAQPSSPPQPAGAAPADAPLRVLWTSEDPSCDGGDVAAHALRLVSPGVAPSPLTATVQVQHEGNWLVRLETESGSQRGRRTLKAESCEEIEQAIALLLAMTMEARGELPGPSEAPPEAAPPPQTLPPPAVAAPAGPPAAVPPSPALPAAPAEIDDEPTPGAAPGSGLAVGWFARAGGKGGKGLQPGYAWGVNLGFGITLGDIDIGVEGQYWPETRQSLPDQGSDAEILVGRKNVGLRACWNLVRVGHFVAAPCVAPQVTFFTFASRGIQEVSEGDVPLLLGVAAAADARYELLGGRLSLLLSLGLDWEKKQPFQIGLEDPEAMAAGDPVANQFVEVYRTTGVGSRLEVGIDARF